MSDNNQNLSDETVLPLSPRERLKICDHCGEIFDHNEPAQREHHLQADHKPLLPGPKLKS